MKYLNKLKYINMNTIRIKDSLSVEISRSQLGWTLLNNLNEDEIFDLLLVATDQHKMSKLTIFERICYDYKDNIADLFNDFVNHKSDAVTVNAEEIEKVQSDFEEYLNKKY